MRKARVNSAARFFVVAVVVLALCPAYAQQAPPKQAPAKKEESSATAAKPKRKRVVSNLAGFDLLETSKTQKQTMVVGATRGLPRPVALAPQLGKIYGAHPVFVWSFAGKADKISFLLRDAASGAVFRREVTGTQFQYPADAPTLEAGRTYFWMVQSPQALMGTATSAMVGFVVVSEAQREEIEKALAQIAATDAYERDLGRARVFTDFRLWYDAIAAYTDLIARYPDRAELYEARGQIYAQLDATQALAEKDFLQAEKPKKKK